MKILRDGDLEFFRPLWRRIAVTVFCSGWSLWEWTNQEPMWALMSGALASYCFWALLVNFKPPEKSE